MSKKQEQVLIVICMILAMLGLCIIVPAEVIAILCGLKVGCS